MLKPVNLEMNGLLLETGMKQEIVQVLQNSAIPFEISGRGSIIVCRSTDFEVLGSIDKITAGICFSARNAYPLWTWSGRRWTILVNMESPKVPLNLSTQEVLQQWVKALELESCSRK